MCRLLFHARVAGYGVPALRCYAIKLRIPQAYIKFNGQLSLAGDTHVNSQRDQVRSPHRPNEERGGNRCDH